MTNEYFCQNDILFRKINPGQNPPICRAFVPKGSRLGLLRSFHDEQCHVEPDKTFTKIDHYFWFPRIARFIHKRTPLHPIDKKPIPFHTVHADYVGPFPVSTEGYKHILLLIDSFTKFLFIVPLKSESSPETI